MAVNLSPLGGAGAQFFDNSGQVLTGGLLYTYLAGTTTPADTYTQSNGITAHPNPIVLNAAGRVPDSGEIWLSDGVLYKFALKDSNGVQIATYDNISGINSNFVAYTSESEVQTATQGQTVFTLANIQYIPATNNLAVYVNGSKQIDPTNYVETDGITVTFVSGLNVGDVVEFSTATPVATNVVDASNVSYDEGSAGAITQNVQDRLRVYVSVKDFGAVGDGTTDDTAAINSALASTKLAIYMPPGTYKVTGILNVITTGTCLFGAGPYATIITSSSSGATISVAASLSGVAFQDFSLTRVAGTAIAGNDGIKFNTLTEQAFVNNIKVTNHWNGFSLCPTSYSFVTNILAQNNYNNGLLVANNATYSGLQWQFLKCLSQTNNGYGLLVDTALGASGASVGEINMFNTYANKLGGAWFNGTASSPINAIRWMNGFVGEDGNHGLYFDTYNSSSHKVMGVFAEIIGTSACGVNNSTPATNVGNGIRVTVNNGQIDILNCVVIQNSYSGIAIENSRFLVAGCDVRINGNANVSGEKNGIYVNSPVAGGGVGGSVISCSSKGHASFGIFSQNDNCAIISNDVRENTLAGIGSTAAPVASIFFGNQGSDIFTIPDPLRIDNVQVVGPRNTGWVAMTGTADESSVFDTSTVTLVQLAQRVKALQDALTTHGLIGT
jgi:hypothetical protein